MTARIATNETHVRSAFNRLDKDGTGFITLENLKDVLGNTYEGEDVEKLLKETDLNNDGKISYEEFMAYMEGDQADEAHQEAVIKVIEELEGKAEGGAAAAPIT